jgi:Acetyltransferases, including N-acetylases of ribosomal proteins
MTTSPLLTTERFGLWQPAATDLADLVHLLEGEEMIRYLGPARPTALSQFDRLLRNAGSWSLYGYGVFYVRPHGSREIIASCGVFHSWRGFGKGMDDEPEAGWIVRQDWWGKGVAGEAMCAVLPWFDEAHGPRRIACMIEDGNDASVRLADKLGFSPCGNHVAEDDDRALLNLFERLPVEG